MRSVLVTGSGRNIGAAITRRLASPEAGYLTGQVIHFNGRLC